MSLALTLGFGLTLLGWSLPRAVAGTRYRWHPSVLLDLSIPVIAFALMAALTARPIFAGLFVLSLGAGYAFADRAKRATLAEPIVFTDVFQAFDIFRHPHLALPFPRITPVLVGVGAVIAFVATLLLLEGASWQWSALPLEVVLLIAAGIIWSVGGPLNPAVSRWLRRLGPSGDPSQDAALFGPLATLLAYGIIARTERPARSAVARTVATPANTPSVRSSRGPLVVVQCESFFDARRLHAGINPTLLPAWDQCKRSGAQWGRLAVPSWGANTVRTEFAVLTGLSQEALGFDRYNPYHRFALTPIHSLAWEMRARGHRTICLHPFDRTFYGRNHVMPNLGFDVFIGEDAFDSTQRIDGYIADVEVARVAASILKEEGPHVFLFIITMENHGPWTVGQEEPATDDWARGLALPEAERKAFGSYLQSLANADTMLGVLADATMSGASPGLLAFYGDHLPAFRTIFNSLGLDDLRSDYLIWRSSDGAARCRNLEAHDLRQAILQAWASNVDVPTPPSPIGSQQQ